MDAVDSASSPWSRRAARSPVAFAQVREDPRIDAEVLASTRPGATVVMIASGGETAVRLSRMNVGRLLLADINPAQLAMCRLKFALARDRSPEESCAILGHTPMASASRARRMAAILDENGIPRNAFGDPETVAAVGAVHAGRYEMLFAEMRRRLASGDSTLDAVLADVMREANLVALFGAEATRNPRVPFDRHFSGRFRAAMASPDARENPFLNELLAGGFATGPAYDWLCEERPPAVVPEFRHGRMTGVLDALPEAFADMIHLSNILDWSAPDEAADCLRAATRVLRPGGKLVVRRLNSTLDIPGLGRGLRWDAAWGRSLHARDRSFFYADVHVAEKP